MNLVGIILVMAVVILIPPLLALSISDMVDRLSIRLSYPGQKFRVRGCNKYGVVIEEEMILTKIEDGLFYFDHLKSHYGDQIACLMPHHISNYRKSFWKV